MANNRIVKFILRIDDSLDLFAEHAVGGMVGLLFNGLFGADYIIGLDGVSTGTTNAAPDISAADSSATIGAKYTSRSPTSALPYATPLPCRLSWPRLST